MTSRFRIAADLETFREHWGLRRWVSHPPSTGARALTVVTATLAPGQQHSFHRHPSQEEVIFVTAGEIEQWVEQEKRTLHPGDAVFIPPDVVHASFNVGQSDATMLAIFGPCVGEDGYEVIDVADEAPWKALRQ
jgi:quercetin dioxygenase-like cupin family protein